MAKPKRRKASLHSAGRVTEADLLANARELAEDPSPIVPRCEGGCVLFSPVRSAQRAIPKVHAARDDEGALVNMAARGNDLARAYAATLLLALSGKVPVVANLRTPDGSVVPYVMRGTTKPFFLAGVQHHDDRVLRLLAVTPWARKRGLHFWSVDDGIVCTGRRATPPADFIEVEAERLALTKTGDAYTCGHEGDAVEVELPGDVRFVRCETCGKDGSLARELLTHAIGNRILKETRVRARLVPLRAVSGVAPTVEASPPDALLQGYLRGTGKDADFLEAARQARVAALKTAGAHLVAGDASYGDDAEAFLDALAPSPQERQALRAALAAHKGPVVLDRATTARAIAELWSEHGLRMLEAVADPEQARSVHKPGATAEEAVELVRKAARLGAARAALAGVPAYDRLPPAAALADAIARAYRTGGADAAVRVATDGKPRGVALAFLQEVGGTRGQEWRFAPSDQDVAASVRPQVEALLRGPPESYHEALVAASRAAGETQTFSPR